MNERIVIPSFKFRTAFAVVLAYVFVISAIISPLKAAINLANASLSGTNIICLTENDGSNDPLKDQKHSHQSECCVVCVRFDLATPFPGDVIDVIAIPTRIPSQTIRFALFQSRAPPIIMVREGLGRDPPLPA